MKTKIKTLILLTLGFMVYTTTLFSQDLVVDDYERKLSYTEFESDYYVLDQSDLPDVALSDKVKLKELQYERSYEKYMDANNERTTIIKHISTEDVYEDWMDEPEIILIDKDGVALYSNEGKQLNRIEHTPTYLDLAKYASDDLLPTFVVPNSDQIRKMIEHGIQVVELEDNFIQITNQSVQMIFNEDLLYIEQNELNEEGKVMHSLKTSFMELPSGEIVFERIRESTVVMLKNNIEAEHVSLRLFSDYRYDNRFGEKPSLKKKEEVEITSNQDQSLAIIKYKPFGTSKSSEIYIYSTNGRLIKAFHVQNSGNAELDINDLAPGVYIIQIQSSGKRMAEKFIKL